MPEWPAPALFWYDKDYFRTGLRLASDSPAELRLLPVCYTHLAHMNSGNEIPLPKVEPGRKPDRPENAAPIRVRPRHVRTHAEVVNLGPSTTAPEPARAIPPEASLSRSSRRRKKRGRRRPSLIWIAIVICAIALFVVMWMVKMR
jgi:hypothetical protein